MPSIRLAELHPIIVHFPIALLLASVALDIAAALFKRATLIEGATWTLLLGTPGAVAALASGWLSEHDVAVGAADSLLHWHKVCAVTATIIFGTLFLLRLLWQSPRILGWARVALPRAGGVAMAQTWWRSVLPLAYVRPLPRGLVVAYLALSVIGVVMLALTGYLGGAIVYDHGVGLPLR